MVNILHQSGGCMSQARKSPTVDEQQYRLDKEFTVHHQKKGETDVFEKGEKFWWNGVHFVSYQDGAKVARSMINRMKNKMIPINPDGTDVDLS